MASGCAAGSGTAAAFLAIWPAAARVGNRTPLLSCAPRELPNVWTCREVRHAAARVPIGGLSAAVDVAVDRDPLLAALHPVDRGPAARAAALARARPGRDLVEPRGDSLPRGRHAGTAWRGTIVRQ